MSNKGQETKIKVYKQQRNKLKDKLGLRSPNEEPGEIEDKAIEEADKLISDLCSGCLDTVNNNLVALMTIWKEMQVCESQEARDNKALQIFTLAHEIKDVSSLCGYKLAAFFAESLRDYIAETAYDLKNQKVIIQAHIDALKVVIAKDIKADAGDAAEELKKMVKVAISKYK